MSSSNLVGQRQKPRFSAAITTPGYKQLINNTLGDPEIARRFVASITSAVAVNPALQDCDAGTILAGGLLGETLGLSPSPQLGHFYLVPFDCKVKDANGKVVYLRDKDGNILKDQDGKWIAKTEKKAQFVLGYKGYYQLAVKGDTYRKIGVVTLKEGEFQHFDPLKEDIKYTLIDDFDQREETPAMGYSSFFETVGGLSKVLYWSKKKMLAHADKYSPAFSARMYQKIQDNQIPKDELWKYSSFWYKNFDIMAEKTMMRQLLGKWGIVTPKLQTAYEKDDSIIAINENHEFVALPPEIEASAPDETDAPVIYEMPEEKEPAEAGASRKPKKVDMDAL